MPANIRTNKLNPNVMALARRLEERAKIIEAMVRLTCADPNVDAADLAYGELRKDPTRANGVVAVVVAQKILQP